ncbi:hypothetical protein [Ramlibacter algicola]|uniref:Uncharacterized protein n=1 Tax=Ramlibacter algicola TaxID=2795217 RepID=A0A934PZG8_9BURK|nr:hypothetical protein [Ramlibacter algicola]MBK0392385.1 hypothetical protein [Ramlibacter algicola]
MSAQPLPTTTSTQPQRVNSDSAGQQVLRAIGPLAGGGTTVAWVSQANGTSSVQAQRFAADGSRIGAEARVPLDASATTVAVAVLPDGGFATAVVRTAPLSATEPWITRTSVSVQRHDASGAALGPAQELAAVQQDRTAGGAMRYVAQPQVVAWADGSFVVGWAVVTDDTTGKIPQFAAQRFDASGQPSGPARDLGTGASDTTLKLATSPAGGWYAGTAGRTMGHTFLRYMGFDGAVAPQLPAGATGIAEGSLLLPLADGGTALLSPTQVYGSMQVYDPAGQPRGTAGGLRTMPVAGVALREGGFVLLESIAAGTDPVGQRYDGTGAPVGATFTVATSGPAPQLVALSGGDLMAAWTREAGGDQDVYLQLVQR